MAGVEHAAGSEATIVRQVWWKRFGFWFGALLAVQGILGLRTWSLAWPAYLMVIVGVFALVVGWRQAVEVTDHGIETRRVARRRNRVAAWDDLRGFERNHAVLSDGSRMALFDWAGDDDAVRARLEDERRARQRRPPTSSPS